MEYSWLTLSRPRLSRITAYLEANIWSLLKHENPITGNKILWKKGKEEKLLLRSNFSSFPHYFQYISNFKSQITYTFVKWGCSINFFFPKFCKSDMSRYGYLENISESPLEFEITRVDCIFMKLYRWLNHIKTMCRKQGRPLWLIRFSINSACLKSL